MAYNGGVQRGALEAGPSVGFGVRSGVGREMRPLGAIRSTAEAPIIIPPPSDGHRVKSVSMTPLRNAPATAVGLALYPSIQNYIFD
jgi:hypothetical protein